MERSEQPVTKTLAGVFRAADQAREALHDLRWEEGLGPEEISLVARRPERPPGASAEAREAAVGQEEIGYADGTLNGTLAGAFGGLVTSMGAVAVPGVGAVLAAGPITAAVAGAVSGGIAGGLVDLGLPDQRARHYERRVKEGNVLVIVRSQEDRLLRAAQILRRHGAFDVEIQ